MSDDALVHLLSHEGVRLVWRITNEDFFYHAAPQLEYCIETGTVTEERWLGAFNVRPKMACGLPLGMYIIVCKPTLLATPALRDWTLGLLAEVPGVDNPAHILALPEEETYEFYLRGMLMRFGFAGCGYWPRWTPEELAIEGLCERVVLAHLWQAPLEEVRYFADPDFEAAGTVCEMRLHMTNVPAAMEVCAARLKPPAEEHRREELAA